MYSQAASVVVNNQITAAYASQPVVIIGYDDAWSIDNAPARRNRYRAADPDAPVTLPHLLVDSGHQTSRGGTRDQTYYDQKIRSMIDSELTRAPQAAISAQYKRVGNHLEFTVQVTNQSGVTLYTTTNGAMVHAVVYETFTDATRPKDLALVNNFVRAATFKGMNLADNATATYALVTPDLPADVNWANLHMLTMVDYRPGGTTGAYDMLQAAFAQPAAVTPTYTVSPTSLTFLVDSKSPANQTQQLKITSNSSTLTWSASESVGWLSVSPTSGSAGTPAAVTVSAGSLSPGTQTATLTIQLSDTGGFSQSVSVPVSAYLGEIRSLFLPVIRR